MRFRREMLHCSNTIPLSCVTMKAGIFEGDWGRSRGLFSCSGTIYYPPVTVWIKVPMCVYFPRFVCIGSVIVIVQQIEPFPVLSANFT